jgi:hypothetical protein
MRDMFVSAVPVRLVDAVNLIVSHRCYPFQMR